IGASYRLFPNVGLGFGALGGEDRRFFNLGSYFLGTRWRLEPQTMVSSSNDKGVSLTSSYEFDRSSIVASGSRVWIAEAFDRESDFKPLSQSYTQTSANYRQNHNWGQWGLKYQRRQNDNELETYSYGPQVRF